MPSPTLRITLATLHLLALALGLGAVFTRSAALHARPLTTRDSRRAFKADAYWGIAAALWLVTGAWRLLGQTEKATSYYYSNFAFTAKMACFVAIVLLELYPMITLSRWRKAARRGGESWRPDEGTARRIAVIGHVEALIVIVMVVLATSMARGFGAR
jgi:putative membrane protein